MAHVDLNGIKARLDAELGARDKARHHLIHIPGRHGSAKYIPAQQPRRIEPTTGAFQGRRHKGTGHKRATVGDLRSDLAARLMHGIRHRFEVGQNLGPQPYLISQRPAGFFDCEVCHGAHPDTALGELPMMRQHGPGRHTFFRHVLVCRRFNKSITQRDGANLKRLPNTVCVVGANAGQCAVPCG